MGRLRHLILIQEPLFANVQTEGAVHIWAHVQKYFTVLGQGGIRVYFTYMCTSY